MKTRKRTPEEQTIFDQMQDLRAKRSEKMVERKNAMAFIEALDVGASTGTKAEAVDSLLRLRDEISAIEQESAEKDAEYRKMRGGDA